MHIRRFCAAVVLLVSGGAAVAESDNPISAPNMDSITIEDIRADVHFLASDEMRGRETCLPEARITAAYVRNRMERAGVKPAGEEGGWYQTVKLAHSEWVEKPSITVTGRDSAIELKYEKDFVSTGSVARDTAITDAPIEFCGYAINDEERKYNDIQGLDLKGKVALMLRFEPSPWSRGGQRRRFSRGSALTTKAAVLRDAGAIGILMVTGPESLGGNDDRTLDLPSPAAREKSPPLYLAGASADRDAIPFMNISLQAADALLGGEGKLRLAQQAFDKGEFAQRPDLSGLKVSLTAKTREVVRECRNVAGRIDGELDEWVIIGAHHDHLGLGYFGARGSDRRNMGQVYNGADDNASGVSTVLEVAEAIAKSGVKPRRGFLFLTFTGEEKGLLGARWYVRNPLIPHNKAVAMINIDMIGRIADKKLAITGTSCSIVLDRICKEAAPLFPELTFVFSDRPVVPASDHWVFYSEAGLPVVFPFDSDRRLYHTAADDPETINYTDMLTAVKLVYEVAWRVSQEQAYPDYLGPAEESIGPDGKSRKVTPKPPKEEDF
jgi:hypothetical protein